MTAQASLGSEWDTMTREQKVLRWVSYWFDWSEKTGVVDISPRPHPPLSDLARQLIAEHRERVAPVQTLFSMPVRKRDEDAGVPARLLEQPASDDKGRGVGLAS